MHTGQIIFTICALGLLTLAILNLNTSITNNDVSLAQNRYRLEALSLMTSYIEQANMYFFDEASTDTTCEKKLTDFSLYHDLGLDSDDGGDFDDFDDFIDNIKKYFKIDSDIFDVDFLFLPESEMYKERIFNDKKVKGFKISFHYETGMDKPEIKIEGNIDDNKLQDYFKNIDISKYPKLKDLLDISYKKEIDAGELSLEFHEQIKDIDFLEPDTEIIDSIDCLEIVFEIPGMDKDNVNISFNDQRNELIFNAENKNRKYMKTIPLPFKSSKKDVQIEVNNGIANIKLSKHI